MFGDFAKIEIVNFNKILFLLPILNLVFLVSPSLAAPPGAGAELVIHGTQRSLVLSPEADNAEVISLGNALDKKTKEVVEGFAIIHFKDKKAKFGSARRPKSTQCYSFLASGAKWKTVEPWIVNTTNSRGLDSSFVLNNLTSNSAKWEDAADGIIGNGIGADILGDGSTTSSTLTADTSAPDDQNEAYFADISTSGAIAVTIVWGIFGGPISQRQLVEWDQVYDDVDFDWSSTGEVGKMDFENIASHESGHSVGMGHPSDSCAEETMYRFANFGETKKRDLASGDIAGANQLY